jgi:hypothetical protein
MQSQQRRFLNVIGISTLRALHVHNIKPMEDFLNEQGVKIVQRMLKDPHHPITTSIQHNKYNNHIIVPRTNTTKYQNSVLQKSLRIIRDGYVYKYTHPRRIETTTALRSPTIIIITDTVPTLCIQGRKHQGTNDKQRKDAQIELSLTKQ